VRQTRSTYFVSFSVLCFTVYCPMLITPRSIELFNSFYFPPFYLTFSHVFFLLSFPIFPSFLFLPSLLLTPLPAPLVHFFPAPIISHSDSICSFFLTFNLPLLSSLISFLSYPNFIFFHLYTHFSFLSPLHPLLFSFTFTSNSLYSLPFPFSSPSFILTFPLRFHLSPCVPL
jgi:hypothetical protein